MESAMWCRTPAAASAGRRLRPEVSKNSSTALSSNEGELVRSITTCAPANACASPSPVRVLTPEEGDATAVNMMGRYKYRQLRELGGPDDCRGNRRAAIGSVWTGNLTTITAS